MDILIIIACIFVIWICFALNYDKPANQHEIDEDIDKKF